MPINFSNITSNASQTNKANDQKNVKNIPGSEVKTEQSSKANLEEDSINLTGSASRIKSLEAQVARLPIVDTQKVEQIKNSISDGTYEINADRISEKMITFENDIFSP